MTLARTVLLLAGLALSAPATAEPMLPTFALNPPTQGSQWSGLTMGSEMFVISRKGQKGLVGGGLNVSYLKPLENNFVLGVSGGMGHVPGSWGGNLAKGFDYAKANVKLGYDMGRVMPYVTAGGMIAKPNFNMNGLSPNDPVNSLFSGSGSVRGLATVGAGVDYAITNNLTVGVSVGAITRR